MKCPECGKNHRQFPDRCYLDAGNLTGHFVIRGTIGIDDETKKLIQQERIRFNIMKEYCKNLKRIGRVFNRSIFIGTFSKRKSA